jgi:hypothetical protein
MSQNPNQGNIKLSYRVAVVDKNTGEESQVYEGPDPGTVQLSNLMCANIFNTAQTSVCKDTGGTTTRTVGANSATSVVQIVAGTDATGAAVTDYKLNAQSAAGAGAQTATVNVVNTGTGVFTLTANMAAPASQIVYAEIGIYLTCATYVFCVARGTAGGTWTVDTSHYLAVTYTVTPS